jgi:TonB family protein
MSGRPSSAVIAVAALVALVSLACATGGRGAAALSRAQRMYDAGRYADAVLAAEQAENSLRPDGAVAAEAMALRARSLEKLGDREKAEAHYRYVVDQYPHSPLVAEARAAIARLDVDQTAASAPSGDDLSEFGFLEEVVLEYPEIRYPELAQHLRVGGTVVVAFQVNEDGKPTQIRVISAPHPLLGGAAIDAISRARIDPTMLGLTDKSALPALRQTKIKFELD